MPAILSIIESLGGLPTRDINLTSLYKYSIEAILEIWKISIASHKEHHQKKIEGYLSEKSITLIQTLESFLNKNIGWAVLCDEDIQMELQVNILILAISLALNGFKTA